MHAVEMFSTESTSVSISRNIGVWRRGLLKGGDIGWTVGYVFYHMQSPLHYTLRETWREFLIFSQGEDFIINDEG
jgi:hypothetical protein